MRKFMIVMMAFLLPLFAFEMRADEKEQIKKIPLWKTDATNLRRDLIVIPIESYYYGIIDGIVTIVDSSNLGELLVNVSNSSTGEYWSYNFDSDAEFQSVFHISGNSGYYEVEYITESGDVYNGEFLIE